MVPGSHFWGPGMAQDIMVGACSRDFSPQTPRTQERGDELRSQHPLLLFFAAKAAWEGRVCCGSQLKSPSIMVRTSWARVRRWPHCVHRQEQGEKNSGTLLAFSFLFNLEAQPMKLCCSYSGWLVPPQSHLSGKALTDTPRGFFLW